MFEIKCADCGKTAMVSFNPKIGKPAYCKACLSKHMFKRSESVGRNSSFDPKQAWARRRGAGQEKRRINILGCFNGLTSRMAKKLVRKRWLAKKAFETKK